MKKRRKILALNQNQKLILLEEKLQIVWVKSEISSSEEITEEKRRREKKGDNAIKQKRLKSEEKKRKGFGVKRRISRTECATQIS